MKFKKFLKYIDDEKKSFKKMKNKNLMNHEKSKNILKIKKHSKRKKEIKYKNNEREKISKTIFLLILLGIYILFQKYITKIFFYNLHNNKKRVGVTNLPNDQNVGNILVKFALFTKLKEYGFNVTMIIPSNSNVDLSFINRTINTNLYTIKKNFSELNESDFDYLIVNSDQTWGGISCRSDIGFLEFAKDWKTKKFIYAASIGTDRWGFSKMFDGKIKSLIKNFTGISFREIGTVKLTEEHLGIKGVFVLDPTLIIDKQYYLNEIKNYKSEFEPNDKFIFVYLFDKNKIIQKFIKDTCEKLNYKINQLQLNRSDYIESFIFGISHSQGVITDSFHGTIFSIMFDKPFITFINRRRGKGRFDSLKEVFHLEKRIIDISMNNNLDINLLKEKPNVNKTLLNQLRAFSINYLKRNLDL